MRPGVSGLGGRVATKVLCYRVSHSLMRPGRSSSYCILLGSSLSGTWLHGHLVTWAPGYMGTQRAGEGASGLKWGDVESRI